MGLFEFSMECNLILALIFKLSERGGISLFMDFGRGGSNGGNFRSLDKV